MKKNNTSARNLSLFEPTENEAPRTENSSPSSAPKIENPCPRCGARGQRSVRPQEHENHTHYCSAGCLSDDRTDAFYFTPTSTQEAKEEARKTIETEVVGEGKQVALIDVGEKWEEHWRGMPEFVQENLTPYKSITVHFEKRKDMETFAKLVAQRITLDTKSIWYPEDEGNDFSKMRYVDSATRKKRTVNAS